jgi:hypothetical protein
MQGKITCATLTTAVPGDDNAKVKAIHYLVST